MTKGHNYKHINVRGKAFEAFREAKEEYKRYHPEVENVTDDVVLLHISKFYVSVRFGI